MHTPVGNRAAAVEGKWQRRSDARLPRASRVPVSPAAAHSVLQLVQQNSRDAALGHQALVRLEAADGCDGLRTQPAVGDTRLIAPRRQLALHILDQCHGLWRANLGWTRSPA